MNPSQVKLMASIIAATLLLGSSFVQAASPSAAESGIGTSPASSAGKGEHERAKQDRKSEKISAADKRFLRWAAQAGMGEVEIGQLAAQKGNVSQVKAYGQRMVQDHEASNSELEQLASSKNISLPKETDAKHKKLIKELQNLSGPAFDRAYMKAMIEDHHEVITEFEKQSRESSNKDVKLFVDKSLPMLQGHHKLAQETRAAVESSAATDVSEAPNNEQDRRL